MTVLRVCATAVGARVKMTAVAHIPGRDPSIRRCWRWFVAAVLACSLVSACGDRKDASLCTAFGEFIGARTAAQAIEPSNLNAAEATTIAESYLAGVRRLEQAADGRYGQDLDALETAVNDVLLTLESIPDDADDATWGPLVQDDLETAADAATVVEDAIEPSCTPDTSGD
jgi:hypothetical protein